MSNNNNLRLAVPFFMVANMEISLDYYIKDLGFTMAATWTPKGKIEWCWLQRDSVAFMLQEPRHKNFFRDIGKPGTGVSICVQCEDALVLYREFKERNVQMSEPFVGNAMWVVSVTDPDGYRIDFESATDIAEETKYTDIY